MRKKILIVIAGILMTVITIACTGLVLSYLNRYKDWQEIDVPEVGTFKIPPDWRYHREDNIIYLTDKNAVTPTQENTYIVGTVRGSGYNKPAYSVFDDNAKYLSSGSGMVLSNSAYIGKEDYILQGKICTKSMLYMNALQGKGINMLVWDNSIEHELAEKIAKSFSMHLEDDGVEETLTEKICNWVEVLFMISLMFMFG